jgi:hypothetical protein
LSSRTLGDAVAILCASETLGSDIVRIEAQVRETIGQAPPTQIIAA